MQIGLSNALALGSSLCLYYRSHMLDAPSGPIKRTSSWSKDGSRDVDTAAIEPVLAKIGPLSAGGVMNINSNPRNAQGHQDLYVRFMIELKSRLWHIEHVGGAMLDSPRLVLVNEDVFKIEEIALQMRKVLELIAYSALLANGQAALLAKPNLRDARKAKNVLNVLEEINPDFFPQAWKIVSTAPGRHHLDIVTEGVFQKDHFVELFDVCSELIHVMNPLKSTSDVQFPRTIREEIESIRALLSLHVISLSRTEKFIVNMLDWRKPPVNIANAVATP
jgi:hypothetical protein